MRPVDFLMITRTRRLEASEPVVTTQCASLLSTRAGSTHGQFSAKHSSFATASGLLLCRHPNKRFSQRIGIRSKLLSATEQSSPRSRRSTVGVHSWARPSLERAAAVETVGDHRRISVDIPQESIGTHDIRPHGRPFQQIAGSVDDVCNVGLPPECDLKPA
jgi:hypothetical protein